MEVLRLQGLFNNLSNGATNIPINSSVSGQGFDVWLDCARDHLSDLLGTSVPELDQDDWKKAFDLGLEPKEAAKNSTQFGDPTGETSEDPDGPEHTG